MFNQSNASTREKILIVSARLFSERGYSKVTTREIANATGINVASIYYHFSSKEDILDCLFRFYTEERIKQQPDLNELMQLVETGHPHEVLMKTEFHFNDEIRDTLDQILVTGAREICADPESERFINDNIFQHISDVLRPLLQRLTDLGKIKPLDIDTFLRIVSYYCFSAAALNKSSFRHNVTEYQKGMAQLFSLIEPLEP